ncbi:MAG: MBL fold metallo-hydrolase [Alphaproteobacteria bacterium]|tara:strand:+ start:40 stop:897 length:858 start_codon:yes stop_codon:yes gene_type:complete
MKKKNNNLFLIKKINSLLIILLSFQSLAQDSLSLKQEINQHKKGIGLWWTGHNGWIIKSDSLVISIDLLLNYDKRISSPPIDENEIAELLDISFITHGHKDHFARSISKKLVQKSKCIFIIPESCLSIAQELNIPKNRIVIAKPRIPFELKGIKIIPLRAIHGNSDFAVYYKANLEDCGYIIEIGGKRFLQPGDSVLLEDHFIQKNIDVLFFSPTEHNMHIKNSLTLIEKLSPKYILPQHHSTVVVNEETYFWAKGYHKEVKEKLPANLSKRYYILNQGDKIQIK